MSTIKESKESNVFNQTNDKSGNNSRGSKTSKDTQKVQLKEIRKNSSFSKSPKEGTEKESKPSKGTTSPELDKKVNIPQILKDECSSPHNNKRNVPSDTPKSNISKPMTIISAISKHEIPSHVNFKKDNFTSSFIKEFPPGMKSMTSAYTNKTKTRKSLHCQTPQNANKSVSGGSKTTPKENDTSLMSKRMLPEAKNDSIG